MRARWIEGETFQGKPVGSRVLIVAAGPIANFVLAVVLFTLLFAAVGRPVALPEVGGRACQCRRCRRHARRRPRQCDRRPAGHRFLDIQRIVVARPGQHVTVRIARGNATETVPVTLGARMMDGQERACSASAAARPTMSASARLARSRPAPRRPGGSPATRWPALGRWSAAGAAPPISAVRCASPNCRGRWPSLASRA